MSGRLYTRKCSDRQGRYCGKTFTSSNPKSVVCPSCKRFRTIAKKNARSAREQLVRDAVEDAISAETQRRKSLVTALLRGSYFDGMS